MKMVSICYLLDYKFFSGHTILYDGVFVVKRDPFRGCFKLTEEQATRFYEIIVRNHRLANKLDVNSKLVTKESPMFGQIIRKLKNQIKYTRAT